MNTCYTLQTLTKHIQSSKTSWQLAVQVNTLLPAEDWAQYDPIMTFADWAMHCLLLFCICQNKAAFLKVPQCAMTERQFACYNICSSVNLESSSPSYFRQSIRLQQEPACYAAIRFIILKRHLKRSGIQFNFTHPNYILCLMKINVCQRRWFLMHHFKKLVNWRSLTNMATVTSFIIILKYRIMILIMTRELVLVVTHLASKNTFLTCVIYLDQRNGLETNEIAFDNFTSN